MGHKISQGKIRPLPNRSDCITKMPKPSNVVELQRLLGSTNYSRDYIVSYAEITRPLFKIMNLKDVPKSKRKKNGAVDGKKVDLEWNDAADQAYENLKIIMCSDLVLSLPNFDEQFIVTSDASDNGYGGVLEQEIGGQNRIVAYFSRSYTTAQKKYHTSEQEMMAFTKSVLHWQNILIGRFFIGYTDHQPLTFLLSKKDPSPRLERWMLLLTRFNFDLRYKKGKDNVVADFLSRLHNENDINSNLEDDYHDQILAINEDQTAISPKTSVSVDKNSIEIDKTILSASEKAKIITKTPSSTDTSIHKISVDEQKNDVEIKWIKNH